MSESFFHTLDNALCEYQTYRATLETPAEYCENEAVEGEDYCAAHLPRDHWEE